MLAIRFLHHPIDDFFDEFCAAAHEKVWGTGQETGLRNAGPCLERDNFLPVHRGGETERREQNRPASHFERCTRPMAFCLEHNELKPDYLTVSDSRKLASGYAN